MIVDANIVTYWFVDTPLSTRALQYRIRADLIAPRLVMPESINALLKFMRAGHITDHHVAHAIAVIRAVIAEFGDETELAEQAARIAIEENHKVYDCFYVALALERSKPLVTADRKLATLARRLTIETELIEPAL